MASYTVRKLYPSSYHQSITHFPRFSISRYFVHKLTAPQKQQPPPPNRPSSANRRKPPQKQRRRAKS